MAELRIYPRGGVGNYGTASPVHIEIIEATESTRLTVTDVIGGIQFTWDNRRIVTSLPFILID